MTIRYFVAPVREWVLCTRGGAAYAQPTAGNSRTPESSCSLSRGVNALGATPSAADPPGLGRNLPGCVAFFARFPGRGVLRRCGAALFMCLILRDRMQWTRARR